MVPKLTNNRSKGVPGSLLETTPFLKSFFTRFWLPFGLQCAALFASILDSIFDSFSGTLLERPRGVSAPIWEPFWLHF